MSLLSDPVIEVTKQLESVAEDRRSTGSFGSPAGHDLNDETVDGNRKAGKLHQLRLVDRLSHYSQGFRTIPGGCLGFLNHQQDLTSSHLENLRTTLQRTRDCMTKIPTRSSMVGVLPLVF